MSAGPQVEYGNIPPELRNRPQWVLWGVDAANPKAPRQSRYPQRGAAANDPKTWGTFESALMWYQIGDAKGIGYEITPADGLVAIDFDHCIDTDGHLLEPFATWKAALPGYWEASQSGRGLHGFVRGTLPAGCGNKRPINPRNAADKRGVELYIAERYIAMTGALWGPQTPLADAPNAQAGVDVILGQMHMRPEDVQAEAALPDVPDRPEAEITAIIEAALAKSPDFYTLWNWTEHPGKLGDESKDDMAFVCSAWKATEYQLSAVDLMHGLDASPWAQTKTNDAKKDHKNKWFSCGARKNGAYRRNTALAAYQRAKQKEAEQLDGFAALAANLPAGGVFTAAELDKMDLPPVQWAVPGLLPAGLSFLVAAPKMGKSWLALDLCLSVASGGEWLGRKVNQGPTLYLDLEDSANRAQTRMRKLLDGFTAAPETCTFRLLAPILGPELFKILDEWIAANPGAKVVCIDTFQKIKPAAEKSETSYSADYRICAPLQSWAQQHNICVLLVHHTNKNKGSTDIFESVNGSQGLTGTADAVLLLTKSEGRFAEDATLSVTGRDVDMERYLARFDKDTCHWELLGTVDEQARQSFENSPAVLTVKELTAGGKWQGTVQELADEVLTRYPDAGLPMSPQGLGKYFNNLWPDLKYHGIKHGIVRGAKHRTHTLARK